VLRWEKEGEEFRRSAELAERVGRDPSRPTTPRAWRDWYDALRSGSADKLLQLPGSAKWMARSGSMSVRATRLLAQLYAATVDLGLVSVSICGAPRTHQHTGREGRGQLDLPQPHERRTARDRTTDTERLARLARDAQRHMACHQKATLGYEANRAAFGSTPAGALFGRARPWCLATSERAPLLCVQGICLPGITRAGHAPNVLGVLSVDLLGDHLGGRHHSTCCSS